MGWADRAIADLAQGQSAIVRPRGPSMRPKILSGSRVTLEPVTVADLAVGDVVLCRVSGHVYLHNVTALQGGRAQIGNNRGRINGWTRSVFGRAVHVEPP